MATHDTEYIKALFGIFVIQKGRSAVFYGEDGQVEKKCKLDLRDDRPNTHDFGVDEIRYFVAHRDWKRISATEAKRLIAKWSKKR